jgi:hypothetical protein
MQYILSNLSGKYIFFSKFMKRVRSDGSIIHKSKTSMSSNGQSGMLNSAFTGSKDEMQQSSDSVDMISSTSDNAIAEARLVNSRITTIRYICWKFV